ncbi:hypothetical protein [Bailinhaonella thermotolerans]|uniref:Uncharacterized protein n=1 Tax=Bailinhaonella thermotolerans TaxID=1070861 RepID=A0A3A4A762_9ACTN|nr:hypothetical protein [Bailinhaonella thermotolerans]RJL21709.1 hypothetical protein D5H75_36855 [Bailinhaonella thermotolerans]
MSGEPVDSVQGLLPFDPAGLTEAQRYGDACVVCHRRWPRPKIRVGRLPSHAVVLACDDCAPALQTADHLIPSPRIRAALP